MDTLFVTILNMSITGSIVIAAVIIIRFFLKKLPKKYSYLLWSVVAFRLCVPVSFESIISIFQFKPLQAYSNNVIADSGVMSYVSMPETTVTSPQAVTPVQNTANVLDMTELQRSVAITDVLPYVWLAGVILFAVYGVISYIRFSKRLSASIKYIDNIYQSDSIGSPFIYGITSISVMLLHMKGIILKEKIIWLKFLLLRFWQFIGTIRFAILHFTL